MQFELPFESGCASESDHDHPHAERGAADTPVGILTGRPWSLKLGPPLETLDRMRRVVPLDFPVTDRLLNILGNRGLTDARCLESFFYPSLDQLPDPFLLREMDRAVARMLQALHAQEKIAIHGDFDVDGITGCCVLAEMLRVLSLDGKRVDLQPVFIPDRATDGYGIASRMIRQWAGNGVTLLVTVDTGATAYNEIELATELGMDVVVLDHHIFDERPPAAAVVNPRRTDSTYPNRELCGVAVAFKFAQALQRRHPDCLPDWFESSVLDLVALGLVADQMDLVGENRILVRKGLEVFTDRQRIRPGLAALLSVAGLDRGFPITASDLAYQIAPRLNACGRIGRVMAACELLLTRDPGVARALAAEADRTNQRRKEADLALKKEAVSMAAPYVDRGDPGLLLASSAWHKGVIGIGAARLVELYQLPTILIAVEGDSARGSARSVAGVDVKAVLDSCSELLVRYGGHAQAAGMTLRTSDIPVFRKRFLEVLTSVAPNGPIPECYDLDLPLLEMTAKDTADLVHELEHMEPFGSGNRKPVFRCSDLRLARLPIPLGGGVHLRFTFQGPDRSSLAGSPALARDFVCFGCGEAWRRLREQTEQAGRDLLEMRWDILFQISRNTFRPRGGAYDPVQQLLVDVQTSDPS